MSDFADWEAVDMARLRVKDKVGLGHLVLLAATDEKTEARLLSNPVDLLRRFIEHLPEGHTIRVVKEAPDVTYVVIPSKDAVPTSVKEKEQILREEAREYEQVRSRVQESKKRSGEAGEASSIPTEVVEATYALMIGHTALSQSSRPPIIAEHPAVLPAFVAMPSPEHHLSARQLVEEALQRDPQSAETWSQLAVLLVSDYLNNWNEAKQSLEAAQDLLRRAEQSLQEALKIDPTVAIAHLAAGLIRRAYGDHQGALDAFDRAVQLEPNSARALTERANQLVMVGRPTEAPPLVLKAITLSPRDPYIGTFYWVLGRTYFVMRNYDDAIVWLRKAVEISPYVWYNRAYLLAAYALTGRHYQHEGITASNDYKGLFSEYTVQRIRNMYETELPQRDPGMLASIQELCDGLRLAGVTER